jgi:hypothetical protein
VAPGYDGLRLRRRAADQQIADFTLALEEHDEVRDLLPVRTGVASP